MTPGLKATEPFVHSYQFQADRRGTYEVGRSTPRSATRSGSYDAATKIAPKVERAIVHPNSDKVVDRITAREFEDPIIPATVLDAVADRRGVYGCGTMSTATIRAGSCGAPLLPTTVIWCARPSTASPTG